MKLSWCIHDNRNYALVIKGCTWILWERDGSSVAMYEGITLKDLLDIDGWSLIKTEIVK